MKIILKLIFIILMLFVIGHGYSQDSIKPDTIITRQIKISEKFSLEFKTCTSCGYNWIVVKNFDTTKLKFIGITPIKNPKNQIGGSMTELWSFQGLAKGNYQLTFIYKRPWLKEIMKEAIVNIKVE